MPSANSSSTYPAAYPQADVDNPALQRVYEALWAHGSKWESNQDWQCIAHDDRRASLGVMEGDSQPVVFNCQAGCTFNDIVEALELPMSAVRLNVSGGKQNEARASGSGRPRGPRSAVSSPERNAVPGQSNKKSEPDHSLSEHLKNDKPTRERRWTYTDENDKPTVIVRRRDYDCAEHPKAIDQLKVGGIAPKDAPYDLYRLKDVRVAAAGNRRIMVVAGEPSVDAAIEAGWEQPGRGMTGYTVTTMRGGEKPGAWLDNYSDVLVGARSVLVVADRDLTGYRHAVAVADSLKVAGVPVRVVVSKTERPHDDVVDHIAAGFSLTDLVPATKAWLKTRILELEQRQTQAVPKLKKNERRLLEGVNKQIEFTDAHLVDDIAERFFGDKFCWNTGQGWLRWSGKRWAPCAEAGVIEGLRKFVLGWIAREGKAGAEAERLAKLTTLLSKSKITNLTTLLRGRLEREANDFDADPDLLNCPNGVVNLRTGALAEHDPKFFMTKMTAVDYRHGAHHADWDAALEALPVDVRRYFLDRIGQSITGYTPPDDKLIIFEGSGANGKTTVNSAIALALGSYAVQVPMSLLMADAVRNHPTELMTLKGARFASIEELPDARRLNVQRLKETVGTTTITARGMYKDFIEFRATHCLFVNTNYLPIVSETDLGTWRRLERIRFPYTFRAPGTALAARTDRRGDLRLKDRIVFGSVQREAVLAALVEHAQAWYANEKTMPLPPRRVVDDTTAWRADDDLVMGYVAERLRLDTGAHVMSADLLADLNAWLSGRGNNKWSDRMMSSRLTSHDILAQKVIKSKVKKVRPGGVSSAGVLSRPEDAVLEIPASYTAWKGVRFV